MLLLLLPPTINSNFSIKTFKYFPWRDGLKANHATNFIKYFDTVTIFQAQQTTTFTSHTPTYIYQGALHFCFPGPGTENLLLIALIIE